MESDLAQDQWVALEDVSVAQSTFPIAASVNGAAILIFQIGEGYRGVQRACPHQRGQLTNAKIMANGSMIRCALHAYTFRLADGKGINCPGYRLDVYEVVIRDGIFYARPTTSST